MYKQSDQPAQAPKEKARTKTKPSASRNSSRESPDMLRQDEAGKSRPKQQACDDGRTQAARGPRPPHPGFLFYSVHMSIGKKNKKKQKRVVDLSQQPRGRRDLVMFWFSYPPLGPVEVPLVPVLLAEDPLHVAHEVVQVHPACTHAHARRTCGRTVRTTWNKT